MDPRVEQSVLRSWRFLVRDTEGTPHFQEVNQLRSKSWIQRDHRESNTPLPGAVCEAWLSSCAYLGR